MSDEYLLGWLDANYSSGRVIAYDLAYVDLNDGNHTDALMFSQIMYWFRRGHDGTVRAKIQRDGHTWIVKQHADWWDECRITARYARRSIARIQERGLIHVETHFSPVHRSDDGKPVKAQFIRLTDVVGERLREWVLAHVEEMTKAVTSTNDQNGQNVVTKAVIYSDEQTTKPVATKTDSTSSEKTKQTAAQLPATSGGASAALSSEFLEQIRYWLGVKPHEIPDSDIPRWRGIDQQAAYSRVDIDRALEIAAPKFWAGEVEHLPLFVAGILRNIRPLTDAEREAIMGGVRRGGSDDIEY